MPEGSPMMLQYHKIKEQHQDCILFFRLGDFYEMFSEDAKTASRELDLTLTTRDRGEKVSEEDKVPMCGVPYHSSEAYIARLVAKGYKVAICEQMEDPALAKGLVDRDVIRIVTPGTVIDASMLEEGRSNYICAVHLSAAGAALCFCEMSTGEICATAVTPADPAKIENELLRFQPAEALLNDAAAKDPEIPAFLRERFGCLLQTREALFVPETCDRIVREQFGVRDTAELQLGGETGAVCAVGALIAYLRETQKTDLSYLRRLDFYTEGRFMELDVQTVRNLELLQTSRSGEKKGSLLWVLDKTRTPMGGRLLRAWIARPLLSPTVITRRQNAVAELVQETVLRQEVMRSLRSVGDLERLVSRVVYGSAGGRDLMAIALSARMIPEILSRLDGRKSARLRELCAMDPLEDVRDRIFAAICDEPPFSVREGGFIRPGYNGEVDHLRDLLENSSGALAAIEARERERTGKKLRVGYNKVFGYYIEIPRSASEDVPGDYIRKQTLVNCERFITQELKDLEFELMNAKDRLAALEFELFSQLRQFVAGQVVRIQNTAAALAELDVLCSLAETAAKQSYCQPEVDLSGVLDITDGRHPVVELTQDALFVPNDVHLDGADCRTAIITGPNMAGKSTYMRQTALIVLLAQIGSFVPARTAHVGIVDRVFTRIGASDDLAAGKSTFMVEMSEVAEILKNATKQSLLILDEIGRGTSTYDGMAIARAVLEYCSDPRKRGAKTLFATHYHELTDLEGSLPGVRNFNITAKKRDGDIIFLRKIVPGGADDSYGIEVANLAGVPDAVIRRAREVLSAAEAHEAVRPVKTRRAASPEPAQVSLEDMAGNEVAEILRNTDLDTMTPLEALNLLYTLRKKV